MSVEGFLSTLPAVVTDDVTLGDFTLRQYRVALDAVWDHVVRSWWVKHERSMKPHGFSIVNTESGAVLNRDVISRTKPNSFTGLSENVNLLNIIPLLRWEDDGWRTDVRRGYVHVQSTTIPDGVLGSIMWRMWRTHKGELERDGYLVKREDDRWFLKRLIAAKSTGAPDVHSSMAESRATDGDELPIALPDGLTLLPFQRAGIQYALKRPRVLFADEMGLGKTVQAIMTFAAGASYPVIVVAPASLKVNWAREIKRWIPTATAIILEAKPADEAIAAFMKGDFAAVPGKKLAKHFSFDTGSERLTPQNAVDLVGVALRASDRVLIVNYDILEAWLPFLVGVGAGCVCFDEFHYVKESSSRRSKAARALAKGARKVIGMTGTPILNRPKELLAQLEVLGVVKELFGSNWNYLQRFTAAVKTDFGWDFSGHANLPELQAILRSNVMVRRLKRDVLTELPPKRRQLLILQPAAALKTLLDEEIDTHEFRERRINEHKQSIKRALANGDEVAYQDAVDALREDQQATFAVLARLRQEIGLAKVPLVIDYIGTALEAEEKVVVFAHHREVIRRIREAFPNVTVGIDGSMPLTARQNAVDAFQNDPNVRLFVGNLVAAGVGITLTAAAHVIFAESDWVPGIITQAEDRCHRVGQRDSVLVTHMVWDGSLDARMAKVVLEKQRVADAALDAGIIPNTNDSDATTTNSDEVFDASWLTDEPTGTPATVPSTNTGTNVDANVTVEAPPEDTTRVTEEASLRSTTKVPNHSSQPALFTVANTVTTNRTTTSALPSPTEAFEFVKWLHTTRNTIRNEADDDGLPYDERRLLTKIADERVWDTESSQGITAAFAAMKRLGLVEDDRKQVAEAT